MLYLVFGSIVLLLYVIVWYRSRVNFSYWKKRGVFSVEPSPFFGLLNKDLLMRRSLHEIQLDAYNKYKSHKFYGQYEGWTPIVKVIDLELVKAITVKDFDHFVDRRHFDMLGTSWWNDSLLNLQGQEWKDVRSIVTPTFSSGKMKNIFETVTTCLDNCVEYFRSYAHTREGLDIKSTMVLYSTDVISNSAFGIQSNCFKNQKEIFPIMANRLVNMKKVDMIKFFFLMTFPFMGRLMVKLGIPVIDLEPANFFQNVIETAIKQRDDGVVRRRDFLQLLLDARKGDGEQSQDDQVVNKKQILTDSKVISQSILFFFGGFESVSTTISFALYEIAVNQDVQDKLREDIDNILDKYEGRITYDAIQEMDYLDMVVNETMRRHPVSPTIERLCTKDYQIPGTDVIIVKGQLVVIPVLGPHMDPEYYPEPYRFDPERFTKEEKANRNPYTFLPFGSGPRNCIGIRFALMETKAVIATLISKFRFLTYEKTQIPIKYLPGFVFKAEKGVWLKVEER